MRCSWRHIVLSVSAAVLLALAANPAAAEGVATGGGSSLPLATPGVDPSPGGGGGGPSGGGGDSGGGSDIPMPPPFPPGSYEDQQKGGGGNFTNPSGASGPNVEIPGLLPTDQPQGPSVSPDEIIVVFPGSLNRSVGSAFGAEHNSTVVDYFRLPRVNARVWLMWLRDTAQFGQQFNKIPRAT